MPHIHEKIDFTATAYIVHNNRVLLRLHDKYKKWFGVGGHIELDEDPNQAVIREVKEEVGLDVKLDHHLDDIDPDSSFRQLVPPDFMNIHYVNGASSGHQHIDLIYLVKSDSDHVVPSGDDQSNDWHWFAENELDDPKYGIHPKNIHYAKAALKKYAAKK